MVICMAGYIDMTSDMVIGVASYDLALGHGNMYGMI